MTEFGRLSGNIDQIELAFVEQEATPAFLMKLSIQLHLSGLSLSNIVSVLEVFGVGVRSFSQTSCSDRSTVSLSRSASVIVTTHYGLLIAQSHRNIQCYN